CRLWGRDHLVFDGGHAAEGGLSTAGVVGAFDPGDDLDAQLVASRPASLPVEDVALQESEERLHGGVVAGGADLAHRADHAVTGQSAMHLPRSKLAASVGVKDAAGDVTTAGDGHLDGGDDEARFHPAVEGPADDPVREDVF